VRTPWKKRPLLVEWDLTGDEDVGFGAVVFLSAAPVRIVKEFEPSCATDAEVTAAVNGWLETVADRYAVNAEYQAFKATARHRNDDTNPTRQPGQWWRPLD
jgi:hypothetical protein